MRKMLKCLALTILLSSCGGNSYEKNPFFTGRELTMVCKRPYSANSQCTQLYVRNNNGLSMTVYLDDGSTIKLDDMYCTETVLDEPICQGVDYNGATWDIFKIESNIFGEEIPLVNETEENKELPTGADSAENAVNAFYNALSMGNGSLAVQFVIPEKQETGNYTAEGMTEYYSGLEQRLKVERIDWVGETQRRVVYSYKEQGKEKCKDMMDVNVAERSSGWFIESIVPRQVCQIITPPSAPVKNESVNQAPSAVDIKIKCEQQGRAQYQDMHLDDGSIEFEFYYSPVLDTCLLQREEYGPGTAFAIMLYDMFTKHLLVHYYLGSQEGEGIKCTAAKAVGQDPLCVKSMDEFNKAKTYLLQ